MDQAVPETLTDAAAMANIVKAAGGKNGIAASVAWLTANAAEIDAFASAEDLAVETGGDGPLAHHLMQSAPNLLNNYGNNGYSSE